VNITEASKEVNKLILRTVLITKGVSGYHREVFGPPGGYTDDGYTTSRSREKQGDNNKNRLHIGYTGAL